jgi:hypothetical protein
MASCIRFRIEIYKSWPPGAYRVVCSPVEYLGRDEFKAWIRTCRKHFMDVTSRRPWTMERVFMDEVEARRFGGSLAYDLGEPSFRCLGIMTPCKVPEEVAT